MRIPQSPPDLNAITKSVGIEWLYRLREAEIIEFVRRCNDSYAHWDQLRHRNDLPAGFDPPQAWAAIAMSRLQQYCALPLTFRDAPFVYWNPPQHLEWLHKIDQQAGGTLGSKSAHAPPDDNERYLFNSLMEEAIASSQLEGALTTRKVAKQMLREQRRPRNRAERMILNNYRAILNIRELQHRQLSPQLLKHLQAVLTEGTLDDASAEGRFRRADDYVVVEDANTHEVLHTPPPAEVVESLVDEICEFANETSRPFIHPVVKAIALHFAVGYVHPFVDGNGRTARAVFHWYMLKQDYWLFEYLPISRLFLKAPAKYARSYLYSETDNGDITHFVHYNLKMILRAMKALHVYLRQQQEEIAGAAALLRGNPDLNHRQQSTIYHALKHPHDPCTVQQYKSTHSVSYGTARSDLLALARMGYLEMVQGKKKLLFYPHADLPLRLKNPSTGKRPYEPRGRAVTKVVAITRSHPRNEQSDTPTN